MSVDYSFEVGYGFAGTEWNMPGEWDWEQWWEGEVDRWLRAQGLDELESGTGGDRMSGPERWSIIAKGTRIRGDKFDNGEVIEELKEPNTRALKQLAEAQELIAPTCHVGWKYFRNVS